MKIFSIEINIEEFYRFLSYHVFLFNNLVLILKFLKCIPDSIYFFVLSCHKITTTISIRTFIFTPWHIFKITPIVYYTFFYLCCDFPTLLVICSNSFILYIHKYTYILLTALLYWGLFCSIVRSAMVLHRPIEHYFYYLYICIPIYNNNIKQISPPGLTQMQIWWRRCDDTFGANLHITWRTSAVLTFLLYL